MGRRGGMKEVDKTGEEKEKKKKKHRPEWGKENREMGKSDVRGLTLNHRAMPRACQLTALNLETEQKEIVIEPPEEVGAAV